MKPLIFAVAVLALLTGNRSAYSQPAGNKPTADAGAFLVLPETTSPDGRYAVAWALPTRPELWQQAVSYVRDGGEAGPLDDVGVDDAENYIVDVAAQKIVARLGSFYSPLPATSRDSFEAVWVPESDLVIVNHRHRSASMELSAVEPAGGRVVDLKPMLGPAVLKFFGSRLKKAGVAVDDVMISYSYLEHLGGAKFSVHADGSVEGEGEWNGDGALVHFTVAPPDVNVLEVRAPNAKAGEVPGSSEHELARADRHLNRAYTALRARLDESEAEALKLEQRDWLKKRDKVTSAAERAEFVAERAKELDARKR